MLSAEDRLRPKTVLFISLLSAAVLCASAGSAWSLGKSEILRYEMTWKGNKAAHGDITMKREADVVQVVIQAVSDGYLKAVVEIWSRIIAKFSATTFNPLSYRFGMRSNILPSELIKLSFDHKKRLVKVDKQKGDERDVHSEKFSRIHDPVSAAYLLRYQKDFSRPMFVDIYDGKDKSRLFVHPQGLEKLRVRAGLWPAIRLALRLVKLTGDKEEVAKATLWVSNDTKRIPLLLTSSPFIGTVRFELVQAQR